MTTEVGSASEVKKESDQLGADATKEKPKEVAENQQNQSSDPEEEKGSQSSPPAESQSSSRPQKKERDPSGSRGISRFIPPWLKKQKSYTLVVAKDGGDKKEPTQAVVEEQILAKEESLPEEGKQAKGDAAEMALQKQQQIKVDVKEEKPPVSSLEMQVCLQNDCLEMKARWPNHVNKKDLFVLHHFQMSCIQILLWLTVRGIWDSEGLPQPSSVTTFQNDKRKKKKSLSRQIMRIHIHSV